MDGDHPVLSKNIDVLATVANEAAGTLGVEDPTTIEVMQGVATALHQEGSFALAKSLQGHLVCQLLDDLGRSHPDAVAAHSKLSMMVQTALMLSTLKNPPSSSAIIAEGYNLLGAWKELGDPMSWNALYSFAAKHMAEPALAPLRAFVFDSQSVSMMLRTHGEPSFHTAELRDERQEAQLEAIMERFPKLYDYLLFGYASRFEDDDDADD